MARSRSMFLVLFILWSFVFSAEAEEAENVQRWIVYAHDGVDYGSASIEKTSLADGALRFKIQSRFLLGLLGTREEISQSATYVVDQKFEPISLNASGEKLSGKTVADGHQKNRKFVLTRKLADFKRSEELEIRQRTTFRALLPEYLRYVTNNSGSIESMQVWLIDDGMLSLNEATCSLLDSDDSGDVRWSIRIGTEGNISQSILTLLNNGDETEEFVIPKFSRRSATRNDAEAIQYRDQTGREILMFPVDKAIGRIDQVESLQVEIQWSGIQIGDLRLQDLRQRVVSHAQQEDTQVATIQISPVQFSDAPVVSLDQKQIKTCLQKSRYIDPRDSQIVKTAQQ